MRNLTFTVTKDVLDLGITMLTARISGVHNSEANAAFEDYKRAQLETIKYEKDIGRFD